MTCYDGHYLQAAFFIPEETTISDVYGFRVQQLQSVEAKESWGQLVKIVFLLCLVLFIAATVLLPSGAAGMEDCESSESGQELLPVLFHAMRFTSCGGTETHNGMVNKHKHVDGWRDDRNVHVIIRTQHAHNMHACSR